MSRELNLVPQRKVNNKGTTKSSTTIILVLLIAGLFVGGSYGYVYGSEYLLNKKVKDLKIELALSNEKIIEKEQLDQQIAATKQQITKAVELRELKNIDTDGLVRRLYQLVEVDGLSIKTISYTAGAKPQINLSCTTPNHDVAQKVWANLRESEDFVESHIPGWSGEGEIAFTIVITAKEGSANEKQN